MIPAAIILMIITIPTIHPILVHPSDLDSAFGILSGIMVSSDPTIMDTRPITGDTPLIIGEEATILIIVAAAILPIAPTTGLISGKTS